MPRLQVRVSLFVSLATKVTRPLVVSAFLSLLLMHPICTQAQSTGLPPFSQFSSAGGFGFQLSIGVNGAISSGIMRRRFLV